MALEESNATLQVSNAALQVSNASLVDEMRVLREQVSRKISVEGERILERIIATSKSNTDEYVELPDEALERAYPISDDGR